jgi:hypothetical protein
MPLAATAHPDHIQVLHINHGKAEPYAQACPGHFRMVLSVDLLDDCVLNNDRKRKTKFQSCDETTTASVLKNTANSLFLHRSLGPFEQTMHLVISLACQVATRRIASLKGAVGSVVVGLAQSPTSRCSLILQIL